MYIYILFIIIGFILLIKGADLLVEGASTIAKKFNIPEIIIGLTIVAIGTSLPELIVSLTSALKNHSDIAIGNVVGSNISNLFCILGICAIIRPLKFEDKTIRLEIPFVIFLTSLLYILGNNGNEKIISKMEGVILFTFFILFVFYNIIIVKKNRKNYKIIESEIKENDFSVKSFFKIILGIIALKIGGDFVVENVSNIATLLNVSEKLISLTIVAMSTSMPELITSAIAVLNNQIDMAIGNIIGSNIFNIVLIMGLTAMINPINYSISYNKEIIIFLIGMLVLAVIPFISKRKKISRLGGVGYICVYISYISNLIYINLR